MTKPGFPETGGPRFGFTAGDHAWSATGRQCRPPSLRARRDLPAPYRRRGHRGRRPVLCSRLSLHPIRITRDGAAREADLHGARGPIRSVGALAQRRPKSSLHERSCCEGSDRSALLEERSGMSGMSQDDDSSRDRINGPKKRAPCDAQRAAMGSARSITPSFARPRCRS